MKKTTSIKAMLFLALLVGLVAPCDAQSSDSDTKPLKVFILAGQSNMQGHAHVRTLDAMKLNPTTATILKDIRDEDGTPHVCEQVWISSIGSSKEEKTGQLTVGFGAEANGPKIGPEFTFGLYMQKHVKEPILIIKTAWGGKSLNTDFRPPSAGPYKFNENQLETFKKQNKDLKAMRAERAEKTGHYYRLMIEHVTKVLANIKSVYPDYNPEQGFELAGFVWFQGWNDMVDRGTYPNRDREGGYDDYSKVFVHFIEDVRRDLSAPELPFVIGVMGAGGPVSEYGPDQQRYKGIHQNFRDAMAAPAKRPEFQSTVASVLTENYWDQDVAKLRRKEKTIKAQVDQIRSEMKAKKISRDEGNAALDQLYAETFTPTELITLKESTSNADYHYMGSAKVMTQIGKGFADAMWELLQKPKKD